MTEAGPPSPAEIARLLRHVARFRSRLRAHRELGIPMPFRRRRRRALETRLRGLWTGAYVATDSGDLAYLPAPLEFQALRILFGGFETHPVVASFLPPGGVALDIGANLGEWTVPLARQAGAGGRVLALEPNPEIAEALRRTLVINNLKQAEVSALALSDRAGPAHLVLNPVSSGESRLGAPTQGAKSVAVRTQRLDDLAAEQGIDRLDLVKIDVEGHERRVIEGGATVIGRLRPAVIMESGHEDGDDRRAIASIFRTLDYDLVAVLHERGALPATLDDYLAARGPCAGAEPRNLLLLPRSGAR